MAINYYSLYKFVVPFFFVFWENESFCWIYQFSNNKKNNCFHFFKITINFRIYLKNLNIHVIFHRATFFPWEANRISPCYFFILARVSKPISINLHPNITIINVKLFINGVSSFVIADSWIAPRALSSSLLWYFRLHLFSALPPWLPPSSKAPPLIPYHHCLHCHAMADCSPVPKVHFTSLGPRLFRPRNGASCHCPCGEEFHDQVLKWAPAQCRFHARWSVLSVVLFSVFFFFGYLSFEVKKCWFILSWLMLMDSSVFLLLLC